MKKYYMVLDTETTSTAKIVYDIAYTIIDRENNVVAQANYLVDDVFNSTIGKHLLEHDNFSKNKCGQYEDIITSGAAEMRSLADIKTIVNGDIKKYNNAIVVAYNAKFDYDALNTMANSFGLGSFFNEDVAVWDLWNIAMNIFVPSKNYVKFCEQNGFYSKNEHGKRNPVKDNGKNAAYATDAETMYSYLFGDVDFVEQHTALADTECEAAILNKALSRKKKLETEFMGQVFRNNIWCEYCRR